MTLRQLGELIKWVGSICAAIGAIGITVHWVAVRPLKAWLETELVAPLREDHRRLRSDFDAHVKRHPRR